MAIQPVPADHARNRRDDAYTDYESLKANGQVRNKRGKIVDIDGACSDFSALDRDRLFQKYCAFMKSPREKAKVTAWIVAEAAAIISPIDGRAMSYSRAEKLIGQGCAGWDSPNSMWWRGVSLP